MINSLVQAVIEGDLNTQVESMSRVSGGDINEAAQCRVSDGRTVFVKYHHNAPQNMFQAEAKGLQLLKDHAPDDILVPNVLSTPSPESEALVLEWIETGTSGKQTQEQLGRGLALIHKSSESAFGLDHDNFIGKLPQSNTKHSSWPDFYFEERLKPQIRMAMERGLLSESDLTLANRIAAKLDSIYPEEPPALLHGDLWGGNFMVEKSGRPVLIDPAVYYGHREMDIAFTQLFGGFSRTFYQAYNEAYPLESGFEDRKDLSNLYPILVHTNLFGGHYAQQARTILQKYAS